MGKEAQEQIHSGTENVNEVVLEAEADFADFELVVDNQTATVEAIKAHDSSGSEYIVVANEANPLVVKFTDNAVSVGVTGFDAGLRSLIEAVFSRCQIVSIDPRERVYVHCTLFGYAACRFERDVPQRPLR